MTADAEFVEPVWHTPIHGRSHPPRHPRPHRRRAPHRRLTGTGVLAHRHRPRAGDRRRLRRGTTIVLNIFPSIDTAVCATSVRTFNQRAAEREGVDVLCVSADLPFAQRRFCGAEGIDRSEDGVDVPEHVRHRLRRHHRRRLTRRPARPVRSSSSAATARWPTPSWCPRSPRSPTTTRRWPRCNRASRPVSRAAEDRARSRACGCASPRRCGAAPTTPSRASHPSP